MRAFFFLIISVIHVGCAARIDDIDERIQDIQQRTSLLEQRSGMPIGSDRELLDGQKLADIRTQVAALRNEITVMSGRLETLEFDNKALNTQVRDLQFRLDQMDRTNAAALANPVLEAGEAAAMGSDAEVEYNLALREYQEGRFERAEALFTAFLGKYPKHSLSDNALFWLGEGYMAKKMYRNAVTKFQDLIEKHPKSDMKCEAMANQVKCLKELGMDKESAAFAKVRDMECQKKTNP